MKVDFSSEIGPDNPPFETYKEGEAWFVAFERQFERVFPIAGPFASEDLAESEATRLASAWKHGFAYGKEEKMTAKPDNYQQTGLTPLRLCCSYITRDDLDNYEGCNAVPELAIQVEEGVNKHETQFSCLHHLGRQVQYLLREKNPATRVIVEVLPL